MTYDQSPGPQGLRRHSTVLNVLFLVVCAGVLFVLLRAPAETTTHLPQDADHEVFRQLGKKEAEQHCEKCHHPEGLAPLPENHPPKYRCLFCHKR